MNQPKWRSSAVALAAALLFGLSVSDAAALGLGGVTVQSALGEPLRADIDIVDINAEELASLKATVASPEAFRAAGLEYSPALANVQISLQRRPDGRHFLQLSSQRPVNDPFIDLILETRWASGRIVRDYTMLFDPANLRQAPEPASARTSPVLPPPRMNPSATAPMPSAKAPRQAPQAKGTAPGKTDNKQVTVQRGDTAGKIASANKATTVSLDQMLVAMLHANPEAFIGGNINRLRSGAVLEIPTAEQAGGESSSEASQTILAQSRDFNEFRRRLAEGAPTTRTAPADRQASGKVQAQVQEKTAAAASADKLTLSKAAVQGKAVEDKIARERQAKDAAVRLAELNKNISDLNRLGVSTGAPAAAAAASAKVGTAATTGRAASAAAPVPAAVASRALASASPPMPTAAVAPVATAAASRAGTSAAPASAAASANRVSPAVAVASTASAAVPAASSPVVPSVAAGAGSTSAPAVGTASAPLGIVAAATVADASRAASAATKAPIPSIAAKVQSKPAAPTADSSLLDDLLDNPLVPAGLGAVLVGLLGFGFYKLRQRKRSAQVDSSFLESRLQPDSFFGGSGGQRIDTNEGGATGSSMVYSPSQLDAAGDVDPVAEADVYLAYGRDLQAEEILKEAMRTSPQRVAIHGKLLEIYAKRRDAKAFEVVATEAFNLTHGEGTEWEHICELGQELDAANVLYRPGGQPAQGAAAAGTGAITGSATLGDTAPAEEASAGPVDLDLDLDFSIGDDPEPLVAQAPPAPQPPPDVAAAPEPTLTFRRDQASEPVPEPAQAAQSLDMEFEVEPVAPLDVASSAAQLPTGPEPEPLGAAMPDLELPDNGLAFTDEPMPAPELPPAPSAPAATADGMIEFDLGALSLDLDAPAAPASPVLGKSPQVDEELPSAAAPEINVASFDEAPGGPLATKFALAQEFNAIGDPDGARSLAEEVLAEASGDLKHRAQRFLAEIG